MLSEEDKSDPNQSCVKKCIRYPFQLKVVAFLCQTLYDHVTSLVVAFFLHIV